MNGDTDTVPGDSHLRPLYRTHLAYINFAKLHVPEIRTREVKPHHAARLRELLINNGGYNVAVGVLSVCVTGTFDTKEFADSHVFDLTEGPEADRVSLVDGGHRTVAIRGLCEDADLGEEWTTTTTRLQVRLWSRIDGEPMTELDWIHIGGVLNVTTSSVLPPSVEDMIFSAVQTVFILARDSHDGNVSAISNEDAAREMREKRVLGRGVSMAHRYARIALRLCRSPTVHESVKRAIQETDNRLGVVHLSCTVLNSFDDDDYLFALASVVGRVNAGAPGRFGAISSVFYRATKTFRTDLLRLAASNNIPFEGLRGHTVTVGGQEEMDVISFAASRFSKVAFDVTDDPTRDKRRTSDLFRKLRTSTSLVIPGAPTSSGNSNPGTKSASVIDATTGGTGTGGAGGSNADPSATADTATGADITRSGASRADAVRKNTTSSTRPARNRREP